MNEAIRELLENKVNEILIQEQKKRGIEYGDIDPWTAYRFDEQLDLVAEMIESILAIQERGHGNE